MYCNCYNILYLNQHHSQKSNLFSWVTRVNFEEITSILHKIIYYYYFVYETIH